ncbi:MAG: 30S ribosomal protein S1 [Spirochaetales bacterium]|nr:30S ribosomal protein S1 [Spirochaetales bacterium]
MENENNIPTESTNNTQEELQEKYLDAFQPIHDGQLITGNIVEITSEYVFIDIGFKSEGRILIEEFKNKPKIGDAVEAVVVKSETRDGTVIVSKKRADEKVFWQSLRESFNNGIPVEGKIISTVKGGFNVDLGYDILAFMPLSKADVVRIEEPQKLIGKESLFRIEKLITQGKKSNILVSRRSWLQEEIKQKKADFFENVKVDEVVKGKVKSFTSFGAFIDIGGFDGLLHLSDMSWGHVSSPKEVFEIGDQIEVKVIKIDPEEQKINLSLKHMSPDPWDSFENKYREGDVVNGTVTKLTNFGAFIKLEDGIEGLAHISELSWVKKIRHPKEVLTIGDKVDVKILNYDLQSGKVSLGLKQVLSNPWEDLSERYPVGMRITRKVKNIASFGVFFEIEEGIDGLLHLDDFSWTKKFKHPTELIKEDDEIEIMIIDIDVRNQKIKLGLKQIDEDPWRSLSRAYPKGHIIEGEITSITDFGMFVKVQGDIEGLISQANLFDPKIESLEDVLAKYKVGDTVKAVVFDIKPSKQKLSLSLKDYYRSLQRQEIEKYIHDDKEEGTATIADFIKSKSSD